MKKETKYLQKTLAVTQKKRTFGCLKHKKQGLTTVIIDKKYELPTFRQGPDD